MKIYKAILFASLAITLLSCQNNDEEIAVALPLITTIDPSPVTIGSTLIISGSNFSSDINRNSVRFFQENISISGTITTAAKSSISAIVPLNLTPGEYSVEVTADGKSAVSSNKLTVISDGSSVTSLIVSGFSPVSGGKGTIIAIQGANFGHTIGENSVYFLSSDGLYQGKVISATAFVLNVEVPTNITQEAFNISVKVGDKSVISKGKFTVTPTLLPTITGFSSSSVYGGGPLTISGFNFGSGPENYQVSFKNGSMGGNAVVLSVKNNALTVIVPSLSIGEYNLTINKYGESVTKPNIITFSLVAPPFVFSGFSKNVGSNLTLTGSGFSTTLTNNKVELVQGDKSMVTAITKATSTSLEVSALESLLPGEYYIRVTISGQSVTLLNPYIVQ